MAAPFKPRGKERVLAIADALPAVAGESPRDLVESVQSTGTCATRSLVSGCTVTDIVNTVAITAIQARETKESS
jgi:hypothetical protein